MTSSHGRRLVPESRWLWRAANPGRRVQLVCFPYAGASATSFAHWAALLPDEIELLVVQLPGRQNRIAEALPAEATPLVAGLVRALGPALDAPFVFFGHSCGATLAYEVARALASRGGRGPEHVFVSAQPPPTVPRRTILHELPDEQFAQAIADLGGIDPELVGSAVLADMLPLVRADFGLWERHRSPVGPPLSCPVTALGGTSDPVATPEDLEHWRAHTSASFETLVHPGDHFYLVDAAAEVVAAVVDRTLRPVAIGASS